jgi:Homing endonuclease associated repeat
VTREQKIAKARELRAEGKTAGQIAIVVGAPASTVRNWYLGGNCEACGKPVDGSRAIKSSHCAECAPRAAALWDCERIVQRIREWHASFGELPTAYDWNPCAANGHCGGPVVRQRYESGDWPAQSVVSYHFGSWNAAIEAAGFAPKSPGQRGPDRAPRIAKAVAA